MKTFLRSFVVSAVQLSAVALLPSACSVNTFPADPASDVDSGSTNRGPQPTLPFVPSNVSALATHDLSNVGDMVISDDCELDTDQQSVSCLGAFVTTWIDSQSDGSKLRVFAFSSLTIAQTAHVHVYGSMPVVLLAIGDMTINGEVSATAVGENAGPGGYSSAGTLFTQGGGPGGGAPGRIGTPNAGGTDVGGISAGGGSFCGVGGQGAKEKDPSGTTPSPLAAPVAYGSASLIPLVAGSSGGVGGLSKAGAGGGAVQLVAGGALKVGAFGFVNVGGGAGSEAGTTLLQEAAGGGSGGSILVEAATVEIDGALAANGGGGGGYDKDGEDGQPGVIAASGGTSETVVVGGNGSAADGANGSAGATATNGSAGAGGGGAGRIRINTQTGKAIVSGKISPSALSHCETEGTLVVTSGDAGH